MVSTTGIFWILLSVFSWSISSIGYKLVLGSKANEETQDRKIVTSLGFRVGLVTLVLTPFMFFFFNISVLFSLPEGQKGQYFLFTFLAALFDIIGHLTYFYALKHVDVSRIYPFINTQLLFTYPLSIWIFNETLPRFIWISAILIMAGSFFVGSPDNKDKGFENLSEDERKSYLKKGIVYGILTGLFFALFFISMTKQNMIYEGEWESNYSRLLLSSILMWVYIVLFNKKKNYIPPTTHPSYKNELKNYSFLGLIACASAGVGDAVYQKGVAENGTGISITISSLTPLFNQVLAIFLLKEHFRPKFLIGVLLIIIGNILVIF